MTAFSSDQDMALDRPTDRPAGGGIALPRRSSWIIGAVVVVLLPLVLWQTALWSERAALQAVRDEGSRNMALYISNLQSEIEKYDYLPLVLAEEKDIIALLTDPRDTAQKALVNGFLERINAVAQASATYVMATDGMTLASSNWNTERSFVGQNFKFRPYFQEAMEGNAGHYFALGTMSDKPGYYLSHPVFAEHGIIGVIVVKVGMERLEATWRNGPTQVIIADKNGITFITSDPTWKFHSLAPLEPAVRKEIIEGRQYHTAPLLPLPIGTKEDLGDGDRIVRIRSVAVAGGTRPVGKATDYLAQTAPVPDTDWTFHGLTRISGVNRTVYVATTLAGLAFVVVLLGTLYLIQRRLRFHDRLAYQQQVARTLKEAHDALEVRVEERTAELKKSNDMLRHEIGERKRAESDLRRAQDELVQAGKLAVLGQISTGISHEINQPLGAIRAYADNARAFIDRRRFDEAQENLGSISELTERMAAITSRLKGFAHKSSGELAVIPVGRAVANALDLLRPRMEEQAIEPVADVPEGDLFALGDGVRLEQVLVNLLSNALDAMEDAPRRCLSVMLGGDADTVIVTVEDTGSGIADGDLGHVFDPFFTTKEVGRGLGLGLAISQQIVRGFGGAIRAANGAGGGAVFTVTLRRALQGAEPAA
jgi:two-component system C4-dicarboxylate transport sensor histidine kinase DctB